MEVFSHDVSLAETDTNTNTNTDADTYTNTYMDTCTTRFSRLSNIRIRNKLEGTLQNLRIVVMTDKHKKFSENLSWNALQEIESHQSSMYFLCLSCCITTATQCTNNRNNSWLTKYRKPGLRIWPTSNHKKMLFPTAIMQHTHTQTHNQPQKCNQPQQ